MVFGLVWHRVVEFPCFAFLGGFVCDVFGCDVVLLSVNGSWLLVFDIGFYLP